MIRDTCGWCGEPLPQGGVGRPRQWCKSAHRQRAYQQRKIQDAYALGFKHGETAVKVGPINDDDHPLNKR